MNILYNASTDHREIQVSTGAGFQKVLAWFEDQGDWFVYYCDTNASQAYINRIVNKFEITSERLFSGLNFEVIPDDQFDVYEKWINNNFNYQGLHKDEKLDKTATDL